MTSPEDELRLAAVANEVFRVTPEALVAETVYFEEHPECAEFTASPLVREDSTVQVRTACDGAVRARSFDLRTGDEVSTDAAFLGPPDSWWQDVDLDRPTALLGWTRLPDSGVRTPHGVLTSVQSLWQPGASAFVMVGDRVSPVEGICGRERIALLRDPRDGAALLWAQSGRGFRWATLP
jgi:hypothetical protein